MSEKSLNIAAAATIGVLLVTYGVPAAVGILGFKSAGIAAGSTGAWMMSLCGGATKAGGAVATCQSIGATGAVGAVTKVVAAVVGVAAALTEE